MHDQKYVRMKKTRRYGQRERERERARSESLQSVAASALNARHESVYKCALIHNMYTATNSMHIHIRDMSRKQVV